VTEPGTLYRATRERLTGLLVDADAADWRTPVPACPGWDVHAVVSHLVGTAEDALAGRITGPPPPEVTAEQVARHRRETPGELLALWAELGPAFEDLVNAVGSFPAALDVGSHEQDIRGALGRPGARDSELVRVGAERMVRMLDCGTPLAFDVGDATYLNADAADAADAAERGAEPGDDVLRARTTPFEVFRLRLGRRSRDQVRAMDWSRDPGDVVDRLFIFGPAESALVE
jgi:uncharacterized protein (TIGR03083 family)